jgi:hypothetical protein
VVGGTCPYANCPPFNSAGFAHGERINAIAHTDRWVLGAVMGFFIAEELVHYYCDHCLFYFRDPAIRRKTGTLLLDETP